MPTPYSRTKVKSFTDTASLVVLTGKAKSVTLSADSACWIDFHQTAVVDNSFLLPANVPTTFEITFPPYVSVVRDTASGLLSILEAGSVAMFERYIAFFKADASLLRVGNTTLTANSNLKKTEIITFTSRANLKILGITTRFASDAKLMIVITTRFGGDASLKAVVETRLNGDANLLRIVTADRFGGDASLLRIVTADRFGGDTNLLRTDIWERYTGDCHLDV